MEEEIKRIYELLYSPIITPFNLLDNVMLPNYSYIKYYKNGNGLTVEMECSTEENYTDVFYYNFDKDNKLVNVERGSGHEREAVYERDLELKNAIARYEGKKSYEKKLAI